MWEWIITELRKIVKILPLSNCVTGIEKDDIISIVLVYLFQNKSIAKKIYENKEIGLLYTIAKKEIYNQRGKLFFDNKQDFSRFQRIMAACEKYGIEPKVENAYKIAVVLEDEFANFTISGVVSLLSQNCPIQYGYNKREESLKGENDLCGEGSDEAEI